LPPTQRISLRESARPDLAGAINPPLQKRPLKLLG
jgi:hypothetical protein